MNGAIGANALYLLFGWLISAAAASWISERKGYGERAGLTLGLLLSAVGLLMVALLPGRPGSKWRVDGRLPRRPLLETQVRVLAQGSGQGSPEAWSPPAEFRQADGRLRLDCALQSRRSGHGQDARRPAPTRDMATDWT
jgi:hypothetical protein